MSAPLPDFKIYPTDLMIKHAAVVSNDVQRIISNRKHVSRSIRDILALAYWTLMFEHHQGILILLRNHCPSPAFALLRPFEEAYLTLFVTMFGNEKDVDLISNGRFRLKPEVLEKQIGEKLGTTIFHTRFKNRKHLLDGLTHGGVAQLSNLINIKDSANREMDIVSSYSDDAISSLVQETMPTIFMAAFFMSEFFDYAEGGELALKKFSDYTELLDGAFAGQEELDKLKPNLL
jgi:hypothetical protein